VSAVWKNHTGDQECHPQRIEHPRTLDELVDLVRDAERAGTTIRMVGSGHSWSDVALTDGVLLEPDGLSGLLALDDGTLRAGVEPARLVRVLGGTRLRELNAALDNRGLALPNMGGYDAQTLAGVVSTSTHGSGLRWGPFPSLVRSLDLVVASGAIVRVEPADGPTDPEAFARLYGDSRTLEQDDATFRAAVCGMGCIGLIHSLVIGVREKFWLDEVRTLSTWEEVRGGLTEDGVLGEGDHYELFVNPYAGGDGRHRVLVTRRADCPEPSGLPPDRRERHPLTELESSLPLTWIFLRLFARLLPGVMAKQFDGVLKDMVDRGYADVSYRVFNIGEANDLPAFSMELGVPLEGDRHIAAVDRILEIAAARRAQRWYHSSPFSLRFVAGSDAPASMMYGGPTMMIELIMVVDTPHGYDLLAGYEQALADLGARPHWGQYNRLTPAAVRALYPHWDDWLAVERRFNASGVFASPFTRRVGI
jgi:L-gulono-1,4-lactone dehydrogenase